VGCAHVEHDGERGAGATAAANGQRRGTELSRRAVPPITMTAVWVAGLGGLLLLFLGTLVGTSWTDQALDRRYQRLAIARRELNEWRHTLHETSRHGAIQHGAIQHCVWCGNPLTLPASGDPSEIGGRVSAATYGDLSLAGTALAVGERH
jgi:hypothetical protein